MTAIASRPLARRLVAEAIGTALLLAAVVGSGIMAERLAGGNEAVALLANTGATAAALIALIVTFGPYSGAHFNPVVTLALAVRGDLERGAVPAYILAQTFGAVAGVILAHVMFDLPPVSVATKARAGLALIAAEAVASFGLIGLILVASRRAPRAVPVGVAAWIAGAYWFTASTSFANPAATIARALSDSFTGIAPDDVPGFIVGEALGAAIAVGLFRWLAAGDPGRQRARP
jgi:glycerol uptake facilitator-like aquaporin